ncbi:phosphatase PAP2 family protein [Polymorphospora rubra]|uniref:Phosphatidic acid phosphatase type 2/haloperoxidase domain-containing protein n=1 Tax=Polymorphospora rubra TaxID=338584 RepID=A0A810MQT5_9ACTN|nr:phosphatase PAP2 family protein [Polymorphospora rubra]BCJ63587.1 hypothetical protein Prubr_06080 [Polymorphospora rubra]
MIARPPLAVPLFALAAFTVLLALVVGGWAPLDDLDTAVADTLRRSGAGNSDLVAVVRVATDVAATLPYLAAGAVVTVVLAVRRDRVRAAFSAAVTVVVPVLWSLMHWLLHHPRPPDAFVEIDSNGFPSGHTSNAAAAALAAVLLLWPRQGRTARVVTVLLAAAFALYVGATRLILLAHWPADVLGGWLLVLGVVPLLATAAAKLADRSGAARPMGSGVRSGSR